MLITGVSGLLGNNLALYWRQKYDILGIYNNHPVSIAGIKTRKADFLRPEAIAHVVGEFSPDIIVHCAALADIDACQMDPQAAMDANATVPRNLAGTIKERGIRLVHISTDAVYDGSSSNYREDDPVCPLNIYGETKLLAEAHALTVPRALVARTAFYGFNIQPKKCFAEAIPEDLAAGRAVQGFDNVMTSCIYTMDLAELLDAALERDLAGVYNVGACDAVSKYDLACLLARHLGFDPQLIKRARAEEHPFKALRAKNLSLNTRKLSSALGRPIITMEQSTARFVHDYRRKTTSISHEHIS